VGQNPEEDESEMPNLLDPADVNIDLLAKDLDVEQRDVVRILRDDFESQLVAAIGAAITLPQVERLLIMAPRLSLAQKLAIDKWTELAEQAINLQRLRELLGNNSHEGSVQYLERIFEKWDVLSAAELAAATDYEKILRAARATRLNSEVRGCAIIKLAPYYLMRVGGLLIK